MLVPLTLLLPGYIHVRKAAVASGAVGGGLVEVAGTNELVVVSLIVLVPARAVPARSVASKSVGAIIVSVLCFKKCFPECRLFGC